MSVICSHGVDYVKALNTNIYGNGTQTLVLAHGYGSDQTSWHYLVPYLVCYFKVVVFDLVFAANVEARLYNETRYSSFEGYADDLVCLLDELNVKNSIYVGHSMSGMIGGIASTKRPQLFNQLVLFSASPRYLNEKNYIGGFEMTEINAILKAIEEDFPSWVKNFAPMAIGVNNTRAIAELENSLGRMKPSIALSVVKTVFLSDLRRVLPRITVPTFVIQSRQDIIVPKAVTFYIKRKLGGAAIVKMLKTKGHFPHLTAYPLVFKAFKRLLHIKR